MAIPTKPTMLITNIIFYDSNFYATYLILKIGYIA